MACAAVALLVICGLAFPATGAASGNVGFGGPSTQGSGAATGEKPQSKLWWNDGRWWASMFHRESGTYRIWWLNRANATWVDTGTMIDDRPRSRADTLWDGAYLYVASNLLASSNTTGLTGNPTRLYRFSYDPLQRKYVKSTGFPVAINNISNEAVTLDKDTTGRLWATWTQGQSVYYNATTTPGNDASWGTPAMLPSSLAQNIDPDDISSVVAFGTPENSGGPGGQIGVMWSNQSRSTTYFAIHRDGDPVNVWQPPESVTVPGPKQSDDHINIKDLQTDDRGRIFAVIKTALDELSSSGSSAPLIVVLGRGSKGGWSRATFGTIADCHTRPSLVLDNSNRLVHVYATAPDSGCPWSGTAGTIFGKTSSIDNLSFAPGRGTPIMRNSASPNLNNVSGSKQTVDSNMGIVLLATDEGEKRYWTSDQSIGSPNAAPVVSVGGGQSAVEGSVGEFGLGSFSDAAGDGPWSVEVDWGDGSAPEGFSVSTAGSLGSRSHVFADGPAQRSVRVSVTDRFGDTGSQSFAVAVVNVAPAVALSEANDLSVPEGATRTYSFAISDPGVDSVVAVDASCGAAGEKVPGSVSFSDTAGSLGCVFPDGPASSTVRVAATDSDGDTGVAATQEVEVANVAPSVTVSGPLSTAVDSTRPFTFVVVDPGRDGFSIAAGSPSCDGAHAAWLVDGSLALDASGGTFECRFGSQTGTATVSIQVTDSDGAGASDTHPVTITGRAPTASFTTSANSGFAPLEVQFTDTSTDGPNAWRWDFGDGNSSTLMNPQHTYTSPGTFTVTLIATNGEGDSEPATATVTVAERDVTPPEVTIDGKPDAVTTSTSAGFSFSANESVTFECSLDGAAFAPCTSPTQYVDLSVATHWFRVRATDTSGNTSEPATYEWRIRNPCTAAPVTLGAVADSWVLQSSPTQNYGTDSILKVESKNRANARAVVRFNLPSVPADCEVVGAQLRLYASSYKSGRTIHARRLAGSWTETAINWNNQPATAGVAADAPSRSTAGYMDWTVTSQVLAMYSQGNHGFLVRDSIEGNNHMQGLHSREKGSDNPPRLVIMFG